MDDIKSALLGDKEAAKRLTETGYFTASGDMSLDSCPFCGEYGECKITGYPPNPEKCREVIRKEVALKEAST